MSSPMEKLLEYISYALSEISEAVPGCSLTLVIRHPDLENVEMVMGDDDLSEVIAVLERVRDDKVDYVRGTTGEGDDVH